MNISKPSILILGASSFLTIPIIKRLASNNLFSIICQSRSNIKNITNTNSDIKFLTINYANKKYDTELFKNCSYVINLVNASALNIDELSNFRRFLKHVLSISKSTLIHISSASVYGNCKSKIISEISQCKPRNNYQKNKLNDEIEIQKIAKSFAIKLFILRPTEIIGHRSLNAIKFIKSYKSASFLKRYFMKSFYGERVSHFVSSKYLVENITKIINNDINPGVYLISQDTEKLNNFYHIFEILDYKIYKNSKVFKYKINSPIHILFLIIYKIFKSDQIPPFSKFISKKPIVNPEDYLEFRKDFLEHIDYILKQ